MIRLRTKLWVFFVCISLLLYGVAYMLYDNSQRSVEEYNRSFNRFLLLNNVSQQTDHVLDALNLYMNEKEPNHLGAFQEKKEKLEAFSKRLKPEIEHQKNALLLSNYSNMLSRFLRESELTLNYVNLGEDVRADYHYAQAVKLSRFILETTQDLIDQELTDYHPFYAGMVQKNQYLKSMGTALFISILLIAGLFTYWFAGGITRPVEALVKEAREISRGNLAGAEIQVKSKDEISYLADAFNEMRSKLQQFIQELKEKAVLERDLQEQKVKNLQNENLLREMELKSLQNQIHPHFLFNTLNTISKQAYLEGAEKASGLIESISQMLRYNLRRINNPVTLEDEVQHVKSYFSILKARFRDRVRLSIDVEPSCLSQRIPVLTLQPLVENAFIHGVEGIETGAEIGVHVFEEGHRVVVEVIDNGVGMSPETVRQLMQPEEEGERSSLGHSTGIGVHNVLKRLRLFYSTEEVVRIQSEQGKGTRVQLLLPIDREGRDQDHVQTAHC